MIKTILYVSRMVMEDGHRAVSISNIVKISRLKNSWFGITGALIASETCFSQWIEGPPEPIDDLMSLLERDVRHTQIKILCSKHRSQRQFVNWAMAYEGGTPYIEKHLAALIDSSDEAAGHARVQQLEELMVEFCKRVT